MVFLNQNTSLYCVIKEFKQHKINPSNDICKNVEKLTKKKAKWEFWH